MTGRDRIRAALSERGTTSTPMVLCYPDIFLRDHWDQVTDEPWWSGYLGDMETDLRVLRDLQATTGEDRVRLRLGSPRADRGRYNVEPHGDDVRLIDRRTGQVRTLSRATDHSVSQRNAAIGQDQRITTREQVDEALSLRELYSPEGLAADGRDELPRRTVAEMGAEFMPWVQLPAPFDPLPFCWGFGSFMLACIETPDLVEYAAQQVLEHTLNRLQMWRSLGVELIWIEDCLTDQFSPDCYRRLLLPYLQELTAAIRRGGMFSIHYYCGNPNDRLDVLLQSGADALSLEEGKKDFAIDIMEIAERVQGRMALLGNIDAIGVMEAGSHADLRRELTRQLEAGRRNDNRFLMGYGSPITPGTPASRVHAAADMLREMAP